jgi:hypothetical protein
VPDEPDVTLIQLTLLDAVHAHELVVETSTVPVSPDTGTLSLVGEIE